MFQNKRNIATSNLTSRVFVLFFILSSVFSPLSHLIPEVFAQDANTTSTDVTTSSVATSSTITIDITANGSQGPLTLANSSQNFDVSWVTSNAAFCDMSSPTIASVMTMGSDMYTPVHPLYPATSTPVTFTITCGDGMGNLVSDSVVVSGPVAPLSSSLDITANGSQGPLNLTSDQSFTLDWISANMTACTLSILDIRDLGSIPQNGGSGVVSSLHSFYPPTGGSHTFVITCTDTSGVTFTDSVLVERYSLAKPEAPILSGVVGTQCGGNTSLSWNTIPTATSYMVYRDGVLISTLTTTSFNDSNLVSDQGYSYEISASNGAGESVRSNTVVLVASSACAPTASTVDITANGSQGPLNLTSDQSFTLDWISANTLNCSVTLTDGRTLGQTALNGTSGVITPQNQFYPGINSSNTYVITCNGSDARVVTDSVTVVRTSETLSSPVLSATTSSQCGGQIEVSWSLVPNTIFYEIYRGGVSVATTSALSFIDSNLNSGSSYAYTVVAQNGYGASAPSNEVTALASAACGSASVTVDITANGSQGPVVLVDNKSFTLDWITANAITCNLVIQGGRDLGSVELNGGSGVINSQNTSYPALGETRTFVLTCAGSNGQTTTDSVTLTRPNGGVPPVAPVLSVTTSSQCGGNTSLSWNTIPTATSYMVYRDGVLISTLTTTSFNDSNLVARQAYEYSVKAANEFGVSVLSNQKTVLASDNCPIAPVVFLSANPSIIDEGDSSTLTWTSTNATSCSAQFTSSSNTSGSKSVTPSTTTTYSITCTGAGGSATATATITVVQAPFCPVPVIESTTQEVATVGQNFTYTVSARAQGTTSPIIYSATNLPEGLTFNGSVISGIPTQSGTYQILITAQNICGSDTDTLTIEVKNQTNPTITVDLTAQPLEIYTGDSSTLSWISGNTISCAAPWTSDTSTSGSLLVSPATTTTYAITCTDGVRTASDTVTVRVLPRPQCELPIVTSEASVSMKVGETVQYSLVATSTTPISYTVQSTLPAWLSFSGNTLTGTPTETGVYEVILGAENSCGITQKTIVITVTNGGGGGGNPITVSLVAQPSTINLGATSTLSWISGNTISCAAPWTSDTSTSGSLLVSPATTTTYAITCTDGVRTASATTTITVIDGPQCVVPNITSELTASGKVGNAFTYTIQSVTGTSTSVYSVATSTLPLGLSFVDGVISGTPSTAGTYTVQISAQNQCGTDAENLVITIDPVTPPSTGGGGGGGGKRGGFSVNPPEVLGTTTECNYLRDYLRIDWTNDIVEVIKLQVFLRELEGFKNLPITGVFDQATFDAVAIFQERYKSDILTPWGHTKYTGFVYILSKKKVNEIVCQREFPLNADQQQEIIEFKAFLSTLESNGIYMSDKGQISQGQNGQGSTVPVPASIDNEDNSNIPDILNENGEEFASIDDKGQEGEIADGAFTTNESIRSIAAAIFAGPQGWEESWNAVLYFFVILCVLYVLSTAQVHRMHKKNPLSLESIKVRKVFWFIVGLLVFLFITFLFGFYSIILPLFTTLLVFMAFLGWLVLRKKKSGELIELPEPGSNV